MNIPPQVKKFTDTFKQKVGEAVESTAKKANEALESSAKISSLPVIDAEITSSSTSLKRAMTGAIDDVEDFYFPPDLIGGTCPRIAGEEEQIVWNAAAEACDTERIHVTWQSFGNRIWYLAVRSADLASHANTWCPLAAVLPTEKDTLPICYTYFGEEIAVLMVITAESLNIFRGTAPIVRAKVERTARELNDAPIINLDPYRVENFTPVPWYSLSLYEDRARRVLSTVSVLASLLIMAVSFMVWVSASLVTVHARADLADALDRTQTKSMQLMREAESMRSSPMRSQIEKFLNVNEGLLSLNGFLTVYDIKDKTVRWRATVPISATADRISAIGGKNIETSDHGVTIGNDAEIEYESQKGGKK